MILLERMLMRYNLDSASEYEGERGVSEMESANSLFTFLQ